MEMFDSFKKQVKKQSKHKLDESNDAVIQMQEASENSQQLQVGTYIVNQGITEERARSVFAEMLQQALKDYSTEAISLACERIDQLEGIVMPRIMGIDGALSSFADPAFQLLLKKAQQTAAATEREDDYSLLSELIICQIQKGSERKNRTGINKAIEIVGDIDSDALCALTVAHALNRFSPKSGNINEGLSSLNDLFESILNVSLPSGYEWLDHLDVLGAIRLLKYVTPQNIYEYYPNLLKGYVCAGIKIDSNEYVEAVNLLKSVNLSPACLQSDSLIEGYVRLPIVNREAINDLTVSNEDSHRPISKEEILVVEKIWELYDHDDELTQTARDCFMKKWDSHDALKRIRTWWEGIPCAFEITKTGEVLAHTNAKICDPSVPDLL